MTSTEDNTPDQQPQDSGAGDPFDGTRAAMRRARKRLDVLEYVLLGGAAVFALVGGALVAYLGSLSLGLPFRITWSIASLLFFLVPAIFVYVREIRGG